MIGPEIVVHGANVTKIKIEIKQGVVIGSSQSAQCHLRYDKGTFFFADLFIIHFYYEVYYCFVWLLLFLVSTTTSTTTLSSSSNSSIRN